MGLVLFAAAIFLVMFPFVESSAGAWVWASLVVAGVLLVGWVRWEKRYAARVVHQRLHQPVFRSMVMNAYHKRCAVCALRHVELLDAAHIIPDSHGDGVAAVSLSICVKPAAISHTA